MSAVMVVQPKDLDCCIYYVSIMKCPLTRLPKPLMEAEHFLSFPQHKQRNLVWTKGTDALEGELQSSSEVDFYIDQVK